MSKFKVGDAVVPANGDPHKLFDHWMECWAKPGDPRPMRFFILGSDEYGDGVIYNANRGATNGPIVQPYDLTPAPRFSVGDKVRALEGWIDITKGETYEVAELDDEDDGIYVWDNVGDKGYMHAHEVELIPSYTSCAAAEVDNLADEYGAPDSGHTLGDILAAALRKPLTIHAGRYYKTRDGRKVGPMQNCGYYWRIDGDGEGNPGHYTKDGISAFEGILPRDEVRHVFDLIAEWHDEPAASKFKVGDRVKTDGGYTFDPGTGTIDAVYSHDDDLFSVKVDGQFGGSWSYRTKSLSLALPTTIADIVRKHSGTAIVCLIENGQPLPSTLPFVHSSRSAAATEANRLAGIHKGKEFGVYECVDVKKVERVYKHEWQRLAADGETYKAKFGLAATAGIEFHEAATIVNNWLERAA